MEKYIPAKVENETEGLDSKAVEPAPPNEETAVFDKETGELRGLDMENA